MSDDRVPSAACPAVAIVLVNWNGWQHAVECIDSLLAQDYPAFHVFVVDNDSGDGSVENIVRWCAEPRGEADWLRHESVNRYSDRTPGRPLTCRVLNRSAGAAPHATEDCHVTVIRSGANLGYAGGANVGVLAAGLAQFDYFWFVNTDTVVHRDALARLVARAGQDARIGMVGSTLRYYDRPDVVQCMGGGRMNPANSSSRHIGVGTPVAAVSSDGAAVERELMYIFGASMLVTSRLMRDVGLMQEDYFLYFEEIDWAQRCRGRFTLAYAPLSHVFHKSGATSSKVRPGFTTQLYYRNRIRFMSRYFPHHLGATRRGLVGEILRHTLRGRWAHARIVASVLWNAGQIARGARSTVGAIPSA